MAKRHTQTFDTYWRGILQRNSPRAQEPGWLDEALNVQCRGGTIEGRPGIRPFNGVAFDGNIRGMGWHVKVDGTRELLVAAEAKLQRCNFLGDPIDIPLTNLPLYNQVRVDVEKVNFLSLSGGTNTTFIYDGVNCNVKWDGTNLSKMGLPNGTTPQFDSDHSGDIKKGRRFYVITLVSPYHEGDTSLVQYESILTTDNHSLWFNSPVQTPDAVGTPTSIDFAAAHGQYDDPQVTKWRLWRTVGTPEITGSKFRFIGEADIGEIIMDNVPDDVLAGSDIVEDLVNGRPLRTDNFDAHITAMVEHRGQLIAVFDDDQSLLRFSNFDPDYMVPEGWPRNFVQPVAHGDGDIVRAMGSFNEWCAIFKENSTHAVIGESYKEYKIVPVIPSGAARLGIGCGFPGAVLQIDNAMFFASRDGIYRLDRSGNLSVARLTSAIDNLYAAANFALGSAAFFDRKRRLFVFLGHG